MKNIFKNKKVIITGNSGFKGSWLSVWMSHLGANVLGISLDYENNVSNFKILNLKKKIKFKKIDIRNYPKISKAIFEFKPDFIFHLAAEAIVKNAYENPKKTWETNTLGTINLLETIKKVKKQTVVVIITSDKVYKNLELNKQYKETDVIGGKDPYSASKSSADLAAQSYFDCYLKNKKNIKFGIARAGNVIGGGDWSVGRIVPDCIKKWSKRKQVAIRNPNSTRPWQHILDVLNGYLLLAINLKKKKSLNGEIYNFGPNIEKNSRVIDIVREMQKKWKGAKWKVYKSKKFPENKLLQLNSKKAKKELKWKCKLNLKKSIEFTIDWYKEYYNKNKKIYEYSVNQIKKFENI